MKQRFLFAILSLAVALSATAQTKQIKDLKSQKVQMERGIQKKKTELDKTRHDAVKKEQTVDFIEDQLQSRLRYMQGLQRDIDTLDNRIVALTEERRQLQHELDERRDKYIRSLRTARYSSNLRNPLLFMFSAKSFPQLYRRMRYAREFAALQKRLGIQVIEQQNRVRDKQNDLLEVKEERSNTMREVIRQRKQLTAEHYIVKFNAAKLRQRQRPASVLKPRPSASAKPKSGRVLPRTPRARAGRRLPAAPPRALPLRNG